MKLRGWRDPSVPKWLRRVLKKLDEKGISLRCTDSSGGSGALEDGLLAKALIVVGDMPMAGELCEQFRRHVERGLLVAVSSAPGRRGKVVMLTVPEGNKDEVEEALSAQLTHHMENEEAPVEECDQDLLDVQQDVSLSDEVGRLRASLEKEKAARQRNEAAIGALQARLIEREAQLADRDAQLSSLSAQLTKTEVALVLQKAKEDLTAAERQHAPFADIQRETLSRLCGIRKIKAEKSKVRRDILANARTALHGTSLKKRKAPRK